MACEECRGTSARQALASADRNGVITSASPERSTPKMADIASVLKAEIARIARKEVRAQTLTFKKASALHRSGIASLRKQIDTLERQLKNQQKSASRPTRTSEAVPDEGLRLRFRAGG